MNDNLLQILMYIFEKHFHTREEQPISMEALMEDLLEEGFERAAIYEALDWLHGILALHSAESTHTNRDSRGFRVFADQEISTLTPEVRGYILYLERAGILNAVTRERVINRLLAADEVRIEEDHVKLITMLVLENEREDYPQALHSMESLLEAQQHDRLH